MRTFSIKAGDIKKRWYLIDAKDMVAGRLASVVAKILRGKNQASFTPHMDHGDCVILVNADKIHFTKGKDKPFYWHTGYPGGIKETCPSRELNTPHAHRVMERMIKRMLGRNGPLREQRMRSLFVYAGPQHRQQAQQPQVLDVASWNVKNTKKEV